MKTTLATVLIALSLCVSAGCSRQSTTCQNWANAPIHLDSISDRGFESALSLEPACAGLVFSRDLAKLDVDRPYWVVVSSVMESGDWTYIEVMPIHGGSMTSFVVDSPEHAAQKVCFVIKGKGGVIQ